MSISVQNHNNNKGLLSCSEPQGIGSILGFDHCDQRSPKTVAANSLRRTLSADMSSKKWLTQHGFSPLKKIASSEELQIEVIPDDEDQKKKDLEQPGQFDIWSSILSQKPSSLPPPYVHPLVKRSKSSLSGKSLQICTENLGSESGSDGFSSYSPSEISSDEEQEEDEKAVEKEEMGVVNYNCSVSRISSSPAPRSFPPSLPSLSRPGGLHMRPHRKNGRLVLETVSVPTSQNYFHAQRQDGRLLLTFIKNSPSLQPTEDDEEIDIEDDHEIEVDEFEFSDEEDEDEEEEEPPNLMEEGEIMLEVKVPKVLPTGVINVHRSALMVNKFMGLTNNRNPTWSDHQKKLEKMVQVLDQEEDDPTLVPQSLPPPAPPRISRLVPTPPPPAVAASFNSYEYCWRRQSSTVVSVSGIHYPLINNQQQQQSLSNTQQNYCNYKSYSGTIKTNNNNNNNHNNNNLFLIKDSSSSKDDHQKVVVLGGEKADHLVPYLRSCKKPRMSLLIWKPYCIATS